MVMTGLETAATVTVGAALIPFLSAWDAKGPAGHAFRKAIRTLGRATMFLTHMIAWIMCGIVARAASIFDPKPGTEPGRHPRSYLWRRAYRGRHYDGVPLLTLLTIKETAGAMAT